MTDFLSLRVKGCKFTIEIKQNTKHYNEIM